MEEIVNKEGRIMYIEPNNVFGSNSNNMTETPDYSDYCVSFNLIVEVKSRIKSNSITDNTKKYVLTWTNYDKNEEGFKHVSFLQGKNADKFNYLSTYYTDIDFQTIKEENIVEGLGIENISVSFDSYYVPTVSIKFIDVRGSSLFGREEAIHTNNRLTSDSVFGCFFTIPYPLFRLQIKGFYGKPVTYQLTCSNFRSNFNSETGNFEAVATFIGYSYSLLTDIPLEYLIAAPHASYYGSEYWDMMVNDKKWELANGEKPIKLTKLIDEIKTAFSTPKEELVSKEILDKKSGMTSQRNKLNQIMTLFNSVISSFKNVSDSYIEDTENNEILFLMFSDNNRLFGDNVSRSYSNFLKKINEYNLSYNNFFNNEILPNENNKGVLAEEKINSKKFCEFVLDNGEIRKIYINNTDNYSIDSIMNIEFNNGRKVNKFIASKLKKYTDEIDKRIKNYSYVIQLHSFSNKIQDKIKEIQNEIKLIDEKINVERSRNQKNSVEINPYIGNIVKIIMCHLETFLHMMYQCSDNIYNSNRSALYLGLDNNFINTDLSGVHNSLPPWTMIYNNGKNDENGGSIENTDNVIAWVGDFSKNFEEEKLIRSLQIAAKKYRDIKETRKNSSNNENWFIPINPCDLSYNKSYFNNIKELDLSGLSGYIGFRLANILGCLTESSFVDTLITTFGKSDAYNFYKSFNNSEEINEKIFKSVENGNVSNAIIDILFCNDDGDKYGKTYTETKKTRHSFETVHKIDDSYNSKDRHPIFKLINNEPFNTIYVHYYNNNSVGLVPTIIKGYNRYHEDFIYDEETNSFIPNVKDSLHNNLIYTSNTKDALNLENENDYFTYENDNIFNVITDKDKIKNINEIYNVLDSGKLNINGKEYEENTSILKDYLWDRFNAKGKLYTNCTKTLNRDITKIEITKDGKKIKPFNKDNKFPNNSNGKMPTIPIYNIYDYIDSEECKYNENSHEWVINGDSINIDNLNVYYNKIYKHTKNSDISVSLFGSPFYYMQNNKISSNESENDFIIRSNKVKCLLFLHTLEYSIEGKNKPNFQKSKKDSGKVEYIPYAYILLIGGYLWRHRYIEKNHKDPIIFSEGNIKYSKAQISDINGNIKEELILMNGKINSLYYTTDSDTIYNKKLTDLFEEEKIPDYIMSNKLIKLFENFVNTKWNDMIANLELMKQINENKIVNYTAKSFISDMMSLKKDINSLGISVAEPSSIKNQISGIFRQIVKNINKKYFFNILGNYSYVSYNDEGFEFIMSDSNTSKDIMKYIYTEDVIVLDGIGFLNSENKDTDLYEIVLKKSDIVLYVNSFVDKLYEIVNNDIDEKVDEQKLDSDNKRDLMISTYMYLKNIWDKWLVSNTEESFKVENFFSNFIFIDSFYKNIFKKLHINLEKLLLSIEGRQETSSLYHLLGDIASENRCLFLSMPDYICLGDENQDNAINNMKSIFTPIPYNNQSGIEKNNKFIFIYTHKPSENASEQNSYKGDSFDIWSSEGISDKAKKIFAYGTSDETDQINRYGYNVPSFGVAFSKQGNHLFKSIKLDMNNPMDTSESIKTLNNIAKVGNNSVNKSTFIGQDVYPIFSNYSYICEIEMMGDAQIMPLMYFQLMNVPMWRGSYMIFNVVHNITPGNMTTTFKGMKMSSNSVPYTKDWYIGSDGITDNYVTNNKRDISYNKESSNERINALQNYYIKSDDNLSDNYWEKSINRNVLSRIKDDTFDGISVNENLRTLYNNLYYEISLLPENKDKMKWNVCLSHVLRDCKYGSKSDHCYGLAMDLKIIEFDDNGNPNYKKAGDYQKNLAKVFDILFCNHKNEIRQCIWEYQKSYLMYNNETWYNFNVLHVSVNDIKLKPYKNEFFIASGDLNYDIINRNDVDMFLNNIPDEFYYTSKRYYGNNNFKKVFINYSMYDNETLDKYFGKLEENNDTNKTLPNRLNNPGSLRENQIKWEGQIYPGENGFAKFKDMKYGTRALMLNLNTMVTKYNANTITKIINRWAPSFENDTKKYINDVCNITNIGEDDIVKPLINDKLLYKSLASAIADIEGNIKLSENMLETAYYMAKDAIENS